jgi:hypothetical protein
MLDAVWNLNASKIELRQAMPALECNQLISRLLAERSVADAKWTGNARRLLVEYDAEVFGSAELVDCLHACGIPAAVGAGYA